MANVTPAEATRNKKLGERVVKALNDRHFDAYYCENAEDAKALVLSLIPEGSSIAWGGSATLSQIGLIDAVKNGSYTLFDRDAVPVEERQNMMRQAFFSDFYLASSNAITEDGQLFNIDGTGNRVAAMIYGPKNVILVAGINKVVKSEQDAVARARNYAAPINTQRFDIDTPCKITGSCANCKSKDSICAYMVATRICRPAKKIKVILVGEHLGF